jgi:hypothetical protein
MAQDSGLWTWPADVAAARSRSDRLLVGSSALYAVGALGLMANLAVALPTLVVGAAVTAILLGVAGSVGVIGKIVVARTRMHVN